MKSDAQRVAVLMKEYTQKLRNGNNNMLRSVKADRGTTLAFSENLNGDNMPPGDIDESFVREWEKRRETHAKLAQTASSILESKTSDLSLVDKIELKLRLDEYELELVRRENTCEQIAHSKCFGFRRIFN